MLCSYEYRPILPFEFLRKIYIYIFHSDNEEIILLIIVCKLNFRAHRNGLVLVIIIHDNF